MCIYNTIQLYIYYTYYMSAKKSFNPSHLRAGRAGTKGAKRPKNAPRPGHGRWSFSHLQQLWIPWRPTTDLAIKKKNSQNRGL